MMDSLFTIAIMLFHLILAWIFWLGAYAPLPSWNISVLIDIRAIIELLYHLYQLKHIIPYYFVLFQVILQLISNYK